MANSISIGTITTPNPTLFVKMDSLFSDPVQYRIQTLSPGSQWLYVNQFCSLLTTYWLNDANTPDVYGIQNLVDHVKISAAQQLINLQSLDQQTDEALNALGHSHTVSLTPTVTPENVNAALESLPVGTRIWAGNNVHVVGFLITGVTSVAPDAAATPAPTPATPPAATPGPYTYTLYDSNIGVVQTGQTYLSQLIVTMGYSSLVISLPA
jgi:hypothetical protein